MTFRVHFPGLTSTLTRDFTDRAAADAFADRRRDAELHMWRHVRVEVIERFADATIVTKAGAR